MIEQIIGYSLIYVICSISLIYWTKKKELDEPKYFTLLISLVLVVLIIPLYLIFDTLVALLIVYFIDAFLGAFLISKFYNANFIDALKFFSWFIFGLFFLFFFVILALGFIIFWIISLFV
jgi:hypothetical protein